MIDSLTDVSCNCYDRFNDGRKSRKSTVIAHFGNRRPLWDGVCGQVSEASYNVDQVSIGMGFGTSGQVGCPFQDRGNFALYFLYKQVLLRGDVLQV